MVNPTLSLWIEGNKTNQVEYKQISVLFISRFCLKLIQILFEQRVFANNWKIQDGRH